MVRRKVEMTRKMQARKMDPVILKPPGWLFGGCSDNMRLKAFALPPIRTHSTPSSSSVRRPVGIAPNHRTHSPTEGHCCRNGMSPFQRRDVIDKIFSGQSYSHIPRKFARILRAFECRNLLRNSKIKFSGKIKLKSRNIFLCLHFRPLHTKPPRKIEPLSFLVCC